MKRSGRATTVAMVMALVLAPATVLIRDLQRLVRIGLRVMFYLSPVVYSIKRIHIPVVQDLFLLNPLTGIIELYRSLAFPDVFIGWTYVGTAVALSLAVLALGLVVFRRLENAVLKEL